MIFIEFSDLSSLLFDYIFYPGCGNNRKVDYPIIPVPFTQVRFTDTFWLPRMETNRQVTIPHAFEKCEENGRMDNFAIAGGLKEGEHRGSYPFDDTDVYKVLEGASYALMLLPDPELDKYLDELIELIGAAQESDGYLYTVRTNNAERLKNWYGDERWVKIRGSHELYNAVHLYEAAVAHFRATGKPSLLNIAIKNADLIDRAFGDNYELPNMSAYNETCAAVGNVYWNHRLFLLHGDAKYIDVMERTLYNGLISGISLDGKLFFYPNSKGEIDMSGRTVSIHQETEYPWKGTVKMTVDPEPACKFDLYVRIPGWARNQLIPSDLYRFMNQSDKKVTITVNGRPFRFKMKNGFARIDRYWKKNDMIVLDLPMPIRRVLAHDSVAADQGRVALQRGPVVYCAEWPDNEGGHVRNLLLSDDAMVDTEFRADMLHGIQIIRGKAVGYEYGDDETSVRKSEKDFIAIPYYAWAHRGKGEMAVWCEISGCYFKRNG